MSLPRWDAILLRVIGDSDKFLGEVFEGSGYLARLTQAIEMKARPAEALVAGRTLARTKEPTRAGAVVGEGLDAQ
jgi:hypothetical protein